MKKIWIKRANSFKEAEKFDIEYYLKMSARERIETVQFLREIYFKMKGKPIDASRSRLRRTVKIIQQK